VYLQVRMKELEDALEQEREAHSRVCTTSISLRHYFTEHCGTFTLTTGCCCCCCCCCCGCGCRQSQNTRSHPSRLCRTRKEFNTLTRHWRTQRNGAVGQRSPTKVTKRLVSFLGGNVIRTSLFRHQDSSTTQEVIR